MMSGIPIDKQLQEYYASKKLSDEALSRLRALQTEAEESKPVFHRQIWPVAAALAIAIIGGAAIVITSSKTAIRVGTVADTGSPITTLAAELVTRHESCQNIEFSGDDLADVMSQMTELGFDPPRVDDEQLAGLHLLGAHYCMVDGNRALHAVFVDTQDRRISLFEAKVPSGLMAMSTATPTVDGYRLEIERRDELLVAFARPVA